MISLRWPAGVVAVAFTLIGCGGASQSARADGGGAAEALPICDGSASVRLRIFVEPQNARELRGAIVRVENGYPSLMIDGSCEYWIGGWVEEPLSRDLGWRRGRLDAALEKELRELLPIDDLAPLQDCKVSGVSDAPTRSLRAATSRARCVQGGPRFEKVWSWASLHGPDLWRQGAPLDEGIRVEAVSINGGDDSKSYVWPPGMPLATLMLPDEGGADLGSSSGVSTLVTDMKRARALRALRAQYVAERTASPGLFYDGQKMTDENNTSALVYMRDQLPYEDSDGLLPFSDPRDSLSP